MGHFTNIITAFQDLFFPPVCSCCQKPLVDGEQVLCLSCLLTLPFTNFHLLKENPVAEMFRGRIPVKRATSFLFFTQESQAQQLIHQLKYKGKTTIGLYLGKIFREALDETQWLQDIDAIIPVPLHRKKQRMRGYNQSALIAKGIGKNISATPFFETILLKTKHTESQTKKNGLERLNNVKDVFYLCCPESIAGKNILLVDDVLTTGATIESCALEVLKGKPKSISLATLAYATDV